MKLVKRKTDQDVINIAAGQKMMDDTIKYIRNSCLVLVNDFGMGTSYAYIKSVQDVVDDLVAIYERLLREGAKKHDCDNCDSKGACEIFNKVLQSKED